MDIVAFGSSEMMGACMLFDDLAKPSSRIYWKRTWVRLELAGALIEPHDVQYLTYVLARKFPEGIMVVHVDRRKCVLFCAGQLPALIDLQLGLERVKCRLALGLALKGGCLYIIQVGKFKAYRELVMNLL